MKERILKLSAIIIPTTIVFSFLIYFFYIKTDMGISESYMGITPVQAPLWFEVIVFVLVITSLCAYKLYCMVYNIKE